MLNVTPPQPSSGPSETPSTDPPYLGESSLFGLLQREDSSTLQQTAERQTLALTDGRHLTLSAQTAVHLVELKHTTNSTPFRPSGF